MSEIPFDKTTNHGWWQDKEHLTVYHGTHKRNVPHIEKSGISVPDPRTGMVSMTLDPHTAHGYAAMSSGERRGEHSFRQAGAKAVTTPEEDRAVTKFKIPMSWAKDNLDPNLRGNIGDATGKMTDKKKYKEWKKDNPDKSDHEYYATTELRFNKPIPPEFYVGHSFKKKKTKTLKEFKDDAMITFRKKVDAKHLVPTRSGSKGGDAGDGGGDGGNGNGGE